MNLSVVIPSYKEKYLKPTIKDILKNAETELEIIAVLDGWWESSDRIVDDPRVKYLHLGKTRGMREAINAGVSVAKGRYLMRTDSHCMFAKGFDRVITENMEKNWIVTPRRYCLDPEKWEAMDIPPVDYERLGIQKIGNGRKFTGMSWERPNRPNIDETMGMQGSCWFMRRRWWQKVIKKLDIKYGHLLQDSHEMIFKTWKAGGKMMVNKNTWFAHKHVSFSRTHNYPTSEAEKAVQVFFDDWEDYYRKTIKPKWKKYL